MNLNLKILNPVVQEYYQNYQATHQTDSGLDLVIPDEHVLSGFEKKTISLGIACQPNQVTSYILTPRSSCGSKTPIRLCNAVEVFHGGPDELLITVENFSPEEYTIQQFQKLFQICLPDLRAFDFQITDELVPPPMPEALAVVHVSTDEEYPKNPMMTAMMLPLPETIVFQPYERKTIGFGFTCDKAILTACPQMGRDYPLRMANCMEFLVNKEVSVTVHNFSEDVLELPLGTVLFQMHHPSMAAMTSIASGPGGMTYVVADLHEDTRVFPIQLKHEGPVPYQDGDRVIFPVPEQIVLEPFSRTKIPLMTAGQPGLPCGYYLTTNPEVNDIATIKISNSIGIIDQTYRGNMMAVVDNLNPSPCILEAGMPLFCLQAPNMSRMEFEIVDELEETARGAQGFGSTGMVASA